MILLAICTMLGRIESEAIDVSKGSEDGPDSMSTLVDWTAIAGTVGEGTAVPAWMSKVGFSWKPIQNLSHGGGLICMRI